MEDGIVKETVVPEDGIVIPLTFVFQFTTFSFDLREAVTVTVLPDSYNPMELESLMLFPDTEYSFILEVLVRVLL